MDAEEFRKQGHRLVDFIADYRASLQRRELPVRSEVEPGYLAKALPTECPEKAESFDDVMEDLQKHIVPGLTHWQSPDFFAFFPANSSYAAVLGELLSAGFGVQGMLWITSPACTELETIVLDWLAKLLALPEPFLSSGKGGGVIQGTASESLLVSLVAARARALDSFPESHRAQYASKLVAYCSDQTHSSMQKACMIVGPMELRVLPSTAEKCLDPHALSSALERDVIAGLIPTFVCATIGTTSSTASDDLSQIAASCHAVPAAQPWLHVDAAYAGSACICPEFRSLIDGVEGFDSFNFNPHKWLLVNFDCSTLWVQNRDHLVNALSVTPAYLRNAQSDEGSVIDYRDWQIPLGRRFRALKSVNLARRFEQYVNESDLFDMVFPRDLALVCFRLRGSNDQNRALLDAVNNTGKTYITHTVLDGSYVLRVAVGSVMTEEENVDHLWKLLVEHARQLGPLSS